MQSVTERCDTIPSWTKVILSSPDGRTFLRNPTLLCTMKEFEIAAQGDLTAEQEQISNKQSSKQA